MSENERDRPLGNNSDIAAPEFPGRLKAARAAISKTQTEMSVALGISLNAIRDYEGGKSLPGAKALQAYVSLGFSPEWLLTGEGEMKRGAEKAAAPAPAARDAYELAKEMAAALRRPEADPLAILNAVTGFLSGASPPLQERERGAEGGQRQGSAPREKTGTDD